MCALSGRFGPGRDAWDEVIQLPFELAAFPRRLYAVLRLPVVSYALPALIAVGQAKHHHAPSGNPIIDGLRGALKSRTLEILRSIQPSNCGFLEATPLTSFVTMSLAGSGQAQHPVARKGVEFLLASQRGDGSWPIDTNLATWVTTLSVNALPNPHGDAMPRIRDWLLTQQYTREHLYTGAAPGAWAWTDLPGGVPDADDTAGAALALSRLDANDPDVRNAAFGGLQWLINLQNADGGLPTFCRGWARCRLIAAAQTLPRMAFKRGSRGWMRPRRRCRLDSKMRFGLPCSSCRTGNCRQERGRRCGSGTSASQTSRTLPTAQGACWPRSQALRPPSAPSRLSRTLSAFSSKCCRLGLFG